MIDYMERGRKKNWREKTIYLNMEKRYHKLQERAKSWLDIQLTNTAHINSGSYSDIGMTYVQKKYVLFTIQGSVFTT